jgi:hypothetical protein
MGFTIRLETEHGDLIEQLDDRKLEELLPADDDRSYVCLRFVDPYGDTTFNRPQMPDLLLELDRIKAKARSEEDRQFIMQIIKLAQRCQREVHTYIKFYGD